MRWADSDPTNQDMEALQKCQNKLLRVLYCSRISDNIVRIEFFFHWDQLMSIMDTNYSMETTGKDNKAQLVQTTKTLNYCNLQL